MAEVGCKEGGRCAGDSVSRRLLAVTSVPALCSMPSSSRPVILQIPDGFIFQLWSKQRIELRQNRNQPKEIAANGTGHQHGDDNSPVRTLGDKPGHEEAHEAPEHAHHDQRHSETVVCHACAPGAEPVHRLTLVPPGSVNRGSRDRRAKAPPPALGVTRPSDSAPWTGAPPLPSLSQGCCFLELVRGEVPAAREGISKGF